MGRPFASILSIHLGPAFCVPLVDVRTPPNNSHRKVTDAANAPELFVSFSFICNGRHEGPSS